MFHFFPYKLARLRAGRFALSRILARAFDDVLFWHNKDVSPLTRGLDVKNPPDAFTIANMTKRLPFRARPNYSPGHAHNPSPDPAASATRRTANLAL
jgi:hypothetical protein